MPEFKDVVNGQRREVVLGMDFPDYLAVPALNGSTLVHGRTSMRHFLHAWHGDDKDTEALLWGRAVHCLLFEPKLFTERYTLYEGRRQGKAWEEFREDNQELEILRADGQYGYASALVAARSFINEPLLQEMIREGQGEVSLFTVEDDLQCKARLDWVSASSRCIVDLKTTRNIAARAFGRQFFDLGYDLKLGLQRRWWAEQNHGELLPVYVIALENKPPFDVAVIPVPDAVLDQGAERALAIIRQVKECISVDRWPGVANGEYFPLEVPSWEMEDVELDWSDMEDAIV